MSRIQESGKRLSQWLGIDDDPRSNRPISLYIDTSPAPSDPAQQPEPVEKDNVVESLFSANNFYRHIV
jgi:hypothetical protein